jgi:PAS domain S-box-containing protein
MRLIAALLLLLTIHGHCLAADGPKLTDEERAWLADHKDSLVLSYDRAFPPIEFQTPEGNFAGMSAEFVSRIEKSLGITFRKQGAPWSDVVQGLQNGTTALAPAIVQTEERSRHIFFTPPYIRIPLVIITSRKIDVAMTRDNLAGMRVAVVRGYASADLVRAESRGRYTVVEVETIREGLRDVSFGVADAFVESLAVAAWFIQQEGLPNLRVAGDWGVTENLSIGVSKEYPLLASAVAKALAALPAGGKAGSESRWMEGLPPNTFFDAQTRKALQLTAALTLGILGILAVLAWVLGRKLRTKMSELENTRIALTDQVARFRMAMEATRSGYWEYHPAQGLEEHSPQWYTMLGYEPQGGPLGLESWSDLVHPGDRDRAFDAFSAYIQGGGRDMYEAEYRMRARDGSWRWILAKGRAVAWDQDGRPTRIIGLNMDAHTTRQALDDLHRFEALNKALIEQTSQFIGLLDLKGKLLIANRKSLDWAGTTTPEVLGKYFWECPWWPDRDASKAFMAHVIEQVRAGRTVRREIAQIGQARKETIFDFTASPFHDENGQIRYIIVEGRDISDLKNKQKAIVESEMRFRTIFENAPYSISINRLSDGRYMDANTAFLERMNVRREDLLTLTPTDVGAFPQEHSEEIFRNLRRNQNVYNLETRVHRSDGTFTHLLYSGGLISLDGEPCILSMTVDITELKAAQEALRRSEEMFSRLFHLSPDIITLARLDGGTLLEVNEAFVRTTGFSREEALGRSTIDLGIFADPSRREAFVGTLLRDGQIENFEFELRHRGGAILNASTSARLMDVGDTPCILAITRDITHLRAMQETMVQSEKMLSLGGIAAGIAHEINNPLGIVLQAVQTITLRTKPDFPKNLEVAQKIGVDLEQVDRYLRERKVDVFIRDIQGAAVRAADIIRHMLDFSRRSESRRSACDLRDIVERALLLASSDFDLKRNYDFKTIRIVRDFPDQIQPCLCTETEIEQVLLNLLRNAAQAMAEAEPPTPEPCIRIAIRAADGFVGIVIADNGPGVPPEHQSRIFEPFFTTKPSGSGTGLGLSVSYFIITKGHGGRMRMTCPPEGGTVFTIELPAAQEGGEGPTHSWTDGRVST